MKWKLFSAVTVLTLALVGCTNSDGNQDDATGDNNVEQTRYNNTGDGMSGDRSYEMGRDSERDQNRNDGNGQQEYEVSEEAAKKIKSELDEIDNVYVLTTENNAYVAAEVNNQNGSKGTNNGNSGNNGADESDNSGIQNTDTYDNDRENAGNNNDGEVSDELKERISKIVKSVDKDIDNVYVSTNPDFRDLTNNYVDDMNNGEPIEGFFDQFGNMVERLFPQNN
ncbi:YhcN/YlaJ family sporulation lipoprotein [Oceanobacillus manasiensis]|uniref:YhcN/YlaJ family sporulation lipoprotein n=1 Tax=Oceanobacillus manasiensis TaxID=586413 RepID=UPI0005A9CD8E|nr:YhcN/YlaJ family sporulation lipoprotein [Oceanobacillus manasiensis]